MINGMILIVNFPFLDGDVPRSPSYGVYISQLIRFARVCSNVDDLFIYLFIQYFKRVTYLARRPVYHMAL